MVDIMGRKENYIKLKKEQLAEKMVLDEKWSELSRKKHDLETKLKDRRNDLLRNKEMRNRWGITNQKDWQVEVNKMTKDQEEQNEEEIVEEEVAVKVLEARIAWRAIDIQDAYWNLQIGLEQIRSESDD